MRRSWLVALLVAGVVCGAATLSWARGGDWGSHPRMGGGFGPRMLAMLDSDRFKSELGLTDEQAGRLRQLVLENEKSSVKTRAEVKVRQIELHEMLRADNPNRDAVLKKAQEISDLRGQMMKQHIESLLTAKTILTPEQQKKMHALMAEHGFRRQPGEGRGPRLGQRPQGGRPPFPQGPQGSEGAFPSTPPEPPVQ